MSGLVVGFLLVTLIVGWVLHPVFAGRADSLTDHGAEGGASLGTGPDPDVEFEIAALRARMRDGRACARCGASLVRGDRFCGGCGAATGAH